MSVSKIGEINCFCGGYATNKVFALLTHLLIHTPIVFYMLGQSVRHVFPAALLSFIFLVYFSSVHGRVQHSDIGLLCEFDTSYLFLNNATDEVGTLKFRTKIKCESYMRMGVMTEVSGLFVVQMVFLVSYFLIAFYESIFLYGIYASYELYAIENDTCIYFVFDLCYVLFCVYY